MNKICTRCHLEKAIQDFSKDKRQKYGHRPECKRCERRRPSYLLKAINYRIKNCKQWYRGIENRLTPDDILGMTRDCYFCHKYIDDSVSLHRLDPKDHYTKNNTVMVHKACHALYGEHNKKPRRRINPFVE